MIDPTYVTIRDLKKTDEPFLWDMLYQAIYVPAGVQPYPRDIVNLPEISLYVQGWGKSNDFGLIAIDSIKRQPIGAIWVRMLTGTNKGFGYVDDETPELAIAVMPEYRGCGVGTKLLQELIAELRTKHQAISLSVSSDNPAVQLYLRLGFETVEIVGDSITMLRRMSE